MFSLSAHLLGGIYLGWSLGANDAANVFGTAVASRMVRFVSAALLCSVFVVLGSLVGGRAGIETIGGLAAQSVESATYTSVGAALSITLMTFLRIPSSTSQAVVGSIIGVGLLSAGPVHLGGLVKVVLCWIGTPIGALLLATGLHVSLGRLLNRIELSLFAQDIVLRLLLVIAGCYGAYALGANNVANVTGVYYGAGMFDVSWAAGIGGASIALGVLTYSKPVMLAVGRGIIRLDAFASLVVVLAEALTVHFYAWVGVPVSTSQAVVGAVIGVGLVKQASALRGREVLRICLGWLATPLLAGLISLVVYFVAHLKYLPGT